jgi:putative MATE family efflux protein
LILFIFMAIGLMTLLYFITPQLLHILIKSPNIYSQSVDYAGIRIFGLPFIATSICFRAFFIGITRTRIITIITLVSAGTNVLLDYIFIFGKFGLPEMGTIGAAYASIIAESVSMLGYVIAALVIPYVKKYKLFSFKDFHFGIIGNVLKVGSPLMLQNWISFSAWLVFFIFIEKMGERDLAVSSIIKSIYLLFLIPMWGFASATNTLTSNLIGQGRAEEVIKLLKKISILTLSIMVVLVQFNFLFPREILSIFSRDVGLVEAAVGPLWVVSVALVFFAGSVVLFNGVSGAGDTRTALVIEIITILLYFIYIFTLTRVFQMTMMIVWTSEIIYMTLLGVLSFIRLRSGKWKKAAV